MGLSTEMRRIMLREGVDGRLRRDSEEFPRYHALRRRLLTTQVRGDLRWYLWGATEASVSDSSVRQCQLAAEVLTESDHQQF